MEGRHHPIRLSTTNTQHSTLFFLVFAFAADFRPFLLLVGGQDGVDFLDDGLAQGPDLFLFLFAAQGIILADGLQLPPVRFQDVEDLRFLLGGETEFQGGFMDAFQHAFAQFPFGALAVGVSCGSRGRCGILGDGGLGKGGACRDDA